MRNFVIVAPEIILLRLWNCRTEELLCQLQMILFLLIRLKNDRIVYGNKLLFSQKQTIH